jgi:HAD superfamily phosphoserine phosphatase-like hydrolase
MKGCALMQKSFIRLVAFDLDGTLLREETVCEIFGKKLGYHERIQYLENLHTREEIKEAREEMALWYQSTSQANLCAYLQETPLAPGTREGFQLLKEHDIRIALVSVTWEFAVTWFAQTLGADYAVGTQLLPDGQIRHLWAEDKAIWITNQAQQLGLDLRQIAAVGDSPGDIPMLQTVGCPIYVGLTLPDTLAAVHHIPHGNILNLALSIIHLWDLAAVINT